MSFIQRTLGADLNFNKVTISLWFLVPEASITAAEAKFTEFDEGGDYWYGILPLLTWGAQSTANRKTVEATNHGLPPPGYGATPIITYGITDLDSVPQGCGYIGLRCGDPDNEGGARLEAYIPTNNAASCTNLTVLPVSYELNEELHEVDYTLGDLSAIEESYNDWFGSESRTDTDVTPDEWHHLLISWDLSGGSGSVGEGGDPADSITASSVMYASLDGVNLTGDELPMFWPGEGFDVNGHVSYLAANHAGGSVTSLGPRSVSLTVGTIPTNPISFPGPPTVDVVGSGGTESDEPVLNVIVAELQIFTDTLIDTSIEANVRAFLTDSGKPENPIVAAALMGKDPEVYFRTLAKFQAGENSGTAGDFTPTGTIAGYTPVPG